MPDDDLRLLGPHFEPTEWSVGDVLIHPGDRADYAYFPVSGIASVLAVTGDHRRYELGMYGREGMGPASIVLGEKHNPNQHVVQAAGAALRIARPKFEDVLGASPTLRGLLMRYVDVFTVQVGCAALSNGSGAAGERLARWLLMRRDRSDSDDLPLTDATIGRIMGLTRGEVGDAVMSLERIGAIRISRDRIRLLDRRRLEDAAADSYGVPEAEYVRLVGPVRADGPGAPDDGRPARPAAVADASAGPNALADGAEQLAANRLFFQVAETANDIIVVTTADLDLPGPVIVYVNPAFTRLTGYSAAEAMGRSPRILQGPETNRATLRAIGTALRAGREAHEKVLNFAKGGARYWLDLRIVPLRDPAGVITHFAAIQRDVTMDKRRLDELEFVADRDALTGIPNRRSFVRVVEAEIEANRHGVGPNGRGPCLAFIDVDHFKQINDTLGHPAGDAVLLGMADRLTETLRRSDMVGRIGGEEFAVWMPSVVLRGAKALADRLRRAIAEEPFETPSGPVAATVSIGVTALQHGDDVARLMKRADAAMYMAKRAGRNRVTARMDAFAVGEPEDQR